MEIVNGIKALRAYDLLNKEYPPDPSYINPGVLMKGSTMLLGGEAKCGKSFVMIEMVRSLSTGTNLFNNPLFTVPKPVRCLYIEAENGERTTVERFKKVFANEDSRVWCDNFFLCSKELDLNFNSYAGIKNISAIIRDTQPQVLILDPISFLYHSDENSNTEVGKLFYLLAQAKQYVPDMSVIFSHHFGKRPYGKNADGWDALSEYNFRGASKWKDGGDTIITMQRYAELAKDYEAWKLKLRFLTRHGSSPPQSTYTFNENNDLRVLHGSESIASQRKLVSIPYDNVEKKITFPKENNIERFQRLLFPVGETYKNERTAST